MPGEPDAAAVTALAAIVTVLTFLSGFVSVRLHGAFRDAVEWQRQLDVRLTSGNGTFPADEMEDAFKSVRRALPDTLATPVLAVLATFGALGIWLAVLTARSAHLRWFDHRAPERFGALVLLSLALVAVTGLIGADYVRLRLRLRSAIADSPVYQMLRAEDIIGAVWTQKLSLRGTQLRRDYSTWALGRLRYERETTETTLADLNRVPHQDHDACWESRFAASNQILTALDREATSWNKVIQQCERERASLTARLGVATRDVTEVERTLARLATVPGLAGWGHVPGLRAITGLVSAFKPDLNMCGLKPESVVEIENWLQSAIAMEPRQSRWRGVSAFLAEELRDTPRAAKNTTDQLEIDVETRHRTSSVLAPTDLEEIKKRAYLVARQPVTYRAAYDSERQGDRWIQGTFYAELYLHAMFTMSVVEMPVGMTGAEMFSPAIECIHETVAGLCEGVGIRWSLAGQFLDRCRTLARNAPATAAGFVDLAADFDGIEKKLIEPRRSAWNANYGGVLPSPTSPSL